MSLAFALALVVAAAEPMAGPTAGPITVLVFVPLCDGAALACGNAKLGDPISPDENLYWGARFGAESFLRGQAEYAFDAPVGPLAGPLLRRVTLTRKPAAGEREVRVTMLAWDGRAIDRALTEFLAAVQTRRADLVVWAGHDRLMDVLPPVLDRGFGRPADAAVLACESERYFGPVLEEMGARSVALTRTFMAPEGYLLEALLDNVARHGGSDRRNLRAALVGAYARYQKISARAAGSVFSTLD